MSFVDDDNPRPNRERLLQLRATLITEAERGRHDQTTWLDTTDGSRYTRDENDFIVIDCKTSMCAAGWADSLAGGKWITSGSLLAEPDDPEEWVSSYHSYGHVDQDVKYIEAPHRAMRLLGLTTAEANQMFYGAESLEEVLEVIDEVLVRESEFSA